jgi:hypothetical protein
MAKIRLWSVSGGPAFVVHRRSWDDATQARSRQCSEAVEPGSDPVGPAFNP